MVTRQEVEALFKDEPIIVGNVVYLRSGGAPITVLKIDEGQALCGWLDKESRSRSNSYPISALTTQQPRSDGKPLGIMVLGELADAHVNPTREQFKAIFGLPLDQPVLMLNLLRFKPMAQYAPADPEHAETPVTGAEAYRRYSEAATPIFERVGGTQFWIGRPELTLIGPADEIWDLAFIARYPTAQSFVDMLRDADYQSATRHRTAATADSRLIRCAGLPPGQTFQPG